MASKPGGPGKTGALFLAGAIVMAIITAVVFNNAVKGADRKKTAVVETEGVMVAAQYIPAGTALNGVQLKRLAFPKRYLSPGSYFTRPGELIGRTIRGDLIPGEIVYRQKLAGDKSRGGLPVMIPNGLRAVSISVNEVKSVAGFVKPGDHVDVIATFQLRSQEEDAPTDKLRLSRTVLQNVLVLATAQTMINNAEPQAEKPPALLDAERDPKAKPGQEAKKSARDIEREQRQREKSQKDAEKRAKTTSSVTLALSPSQAEQAALLEEASEIHLTLRGEGDTKTTTLGSAESRQLILGAGAPAPGAWPFARPAARSADPVTPATPRPGSSGRTVELIQGGSKSTVNF
ncbi:MAG: Flp pilus assembly protein CpaB [Vampirovibrionales bacterium]|nr:Flp pilus assembly protein CpaB [Vampirovibrionales bacterium]